MGKSGLGLGSGEVGLDGTSDDTVAMDDINLVRALPVVPVARFSSSAARWKQTVNKMRLRKNQAASNEVSNNSDGEIDDAPTPIASSPLLSSGRSENAVDDAASKEEKTPLSPSPPFLVPSASQAKALREHVSSFAKRSNSLGALVAIETALFWVITAVAPTVFDKSVVRFAGQHSSSPTTWTTAGNATRAPTFYYFLFFLAWGVLRAAAYVRTVILMHDLVHGIVFTDRRVNAVLADVFGFAAWTSARDFGRNHGRHHARLGVVEELDWDADHTVFWTKGEWEAWSPGPSKLMARVFRDPIVYHLFSAPAYLLFFGSTHPGFGPGVTSHETVARLFGEQWLRIVGVVGGFSAIARFISYERFLQELAAGWLGLVCGAAIFALQHDAIAPPLRGYRAVSASHSRDAAALLGSTYVPLPRWLSRRVTLGIEFHHVHHLDARVPCYELHECHHSLVDRSAPSASPWEEAGVPVLRGWRDALRGLSMSLYDEGTGQFAPFPPLLPTLKPGQAMDVVKRVVDEATRGLARKRVS